MKLLYKKEIKDLSIFRAPKSIKEEAWNEAEILIRYRSEWQLQQYFLKIRSTKKY